MIQANELRIGNLVEIEQYNHIRNIVRICSGSEIDQVIKLRHTPIPLTPEILEKCGFVSNPYQDRYELGDIYVNYCGIRNICWIENVPHIEYLHQLQNYVYINTNKELTFKP